LLAATGSFPACAALGCLIQEVDCFCIVILLISRPGERDQSADMPMALRCHIQEVDYVEDAELDQEMSGDLEDIGGRVEFERRSFSWPCCH
jgi:hypothetical protein